MTTTRKRIFLMLIAALLLIPGLNLLLEDTAQAGSQTFYVPNETIDTPVNLINGSFELPSVFDTSPSAGWAGLTYGLYGGVLHGYTPGWYSYPTYTGNLGTAGAHRINIMHANAIGVGSVVDGVQCTEPNTDFSQRLYQVVTTTPNKRYYWSFGHRARRTGNNTSGTNFDVMNFYIRPSGSANVSPSSTYLIRSARTNGLAWVIYRGAYTVPSGQTSTQLDFVQISTGTGTAVHGNMLDDVRFQTSANLIAKKSIATSVAGNATALKGEIVTITVAITNWGETDASRCVFRDILSDGLEYIAGSATISGNPAGALATFNSTTDELRVNFGTGATAGTSSTNGGSIQGSRNRGTSGTTGQGSSFSIEFQARVIGDAGDVVLNQARVTYNDRGWESYNASDYTSYSSVTDRTVDSSDQTTYVNQFTIIGASVSGRIWADQNADGTLDASEVRLSGIPVTLYGATDTTFSNPLLTTTTDASGRYTFSNLGVGNYQVAITTPNFYYVTTLANDNDAVANGTRAVITPINVSSNVSITNQDFGLVPYSPDISGRVWIDADVDGTIDPTETRISGLLVGLYLSTDTTYASPVRTTYTDSNGAYIFPQLNPGNYKVAALTPDEHFVTVLANDNDAVAEATRAVINGLTIIGINSILNQDIGFAPVLNSVSGKVWYDTNWDGNIGTEQGIFDKTVWLFLSSDTTFSNPIMTTTTNIDGDYSFSGFGPGSYTVATMTPSEHYVTILGDNNAVANGGNGVIAGLVFGNSTELDNQDIGFAPYKSISGRVFYDLDQDGMIDATDTPYIGATVTLYLASDTTFSTPATDAFGNPLVTTTQEDDEGDGYAYYYFPNVPNAAYTAVMTTPSGYQVTLKTVSTDNDAEANGTRAVVTGLDLTGSNPSVGNVDFGFRFNPVTLTITKQVTGDLADANQTFNFQIRLLGVMTTLNYTGASTVAGVPAPANGTISSGFGTVTLRHGQNITIEGVPYGTEYQVSEILVFSRYSVTITEQNGNPFTPLGSTGATGTLTNNGSLLFSNVLNGVVPTGILIDVFPFALMAVLLGGVVALSLTLASKKKRSARRDS